MDMSEVLEKQCAAVRTHVGAMRLPPQKWIPLRWMLTCQGHSPSKAFSPPTIRLNIFGCPQALRVLAPSVPASKQRGSSAIFTKPRSVTPCSYLIRGSLSIDDKEGQPGKLVLWPCGLICLEQVDTFFVHTGISSSTLHPCFCLEV